MPKSSKKKKDKAADFSKAKLKLGKGKQVANNATDTSFKTRSITLPQQTIGHEKNVSKATTRRNLTLDDLLIHLKHYNPTTRRDAILGLRELFDAYPEMMESSLAPVIQTCARVIGDEDAEVRKALLNFLGWFLRMAPSHLIRPHTPLLMLFITSAQTHIFPAIRIDAVRFLDLLLEITPEIVTQGWNEIGSTGARVLEGYLGLLNAGSNFWTGLKDDAPAPSTSSVTLSLNSQLVVLSSLASFLRNAISPSLLQKGSGIPTWYMASSFSSREEFDAFCSLVYPRQFGRSDDPITDIEWSHKIQEPYMEDFVGTFDCAWDPMIGSMLSLNELGEIEQVVGTLSTTPVAVSQSDNTISRIARLAHTLHPILVATWLDVAPNVFGIGASGNELEVQLAISVTQIVKCLYDTIFRDGDLAGEALSCAFDDITALLGYMSAYLPCIPETGKAQSEELLHHLSFAYCELTSLAVTASQYGSEQFASKGPGSSKAKQIRALTTQVDRVGTYVIKALNGELKSVSHPLGYPLTASSYVMLLPTIWSLLKYRNTAENATISETICVSCISHALRTSSKSSTKVAATQFVGMLAMLHSQRERPFGFELTSTELDGFKEWHQGLPKILWEVGTGDPLLTEIILRLILRIAQRRSVFFDTATSASIRARFIPYFSTAHPEKGEILGPFTKLRQWPRLRRLALDATSALVQDAAPTADVLRTAVERAVKDTEEAQYWHSLLP